VATSKSQTAWCGAYFTHPTRSYPILIFALAILNLSQMKVKSDTAMERFTETSIKFSDGTIIDADLVVFCTG
jgi:hypothetical protein